MCRQVPAEEPGESDDVLLKGLLRQGAGFAPDPDLAGEFIDHGTDGGGLATSLEPVDEGPRLFTHADGNRHL